MSATITLTPREQAVLLTAEQIITAAPRAGALIDVQVPEWGGAVKIKGFTRAEVKAMRRQATVTKMVDGKPVEDLDTDKLEELLFLDGLVEPKLTLDHWVELQNRTAGGVEKVLQAITKASGLAGEEVKATKNAFPEADPEVA